ncbi:MAG: NAD(P)-binding domain-containing protein, partial [Rubripirellula sp.]|nr:NAD(P)-binding domain-containing protein [Rubripirellula sp.]
MHHVALLGTGTLGESIGHRLLQQGISLKVWNRSAERCHGLHDAGATVVDTPADAITHQCSTIVTVLRDGPVTAKVVAGLGPLHHSTVIPMGTMGVSESKALATQVQRQNGSYLEAPVL